MNLNAIIEIQKLDGYNHWRKLKKASNYTLPNGVEHGKMKQKKDPFSDEERINLNETAIEKIYVSLLQWFAEKLYFLSNYFINWVSLNKYYMPSKCFYAVFQQSAKRYDLGLSNEPLLIIIGQWTANL